MFERISMVKKGLRIQPVPENQIQSIGNFIAAFEKLKAFHDKNKANYYNASNTSVKSDYKNNAELQQLYRDALRLARDIQHADIEEVNKRYGSDKKITDSDFFHKWINKRQYGQLADNEIAESNFFKGKYLKNGTGYEGLEELYKGVVAAQQNKNRNPKTYWKWFEDKAVWGSDQPEAIAEDEKVEEKVVQEAEEDREHRLINDWTKAWNNKTENEYYNSLQKPDKDWLDTLANDYDKWKDMSGADQVKQFGDHRHELLQQLHNAYTGVPTSDVKETPKVEEKPINTPVVEEPVNDETRGSDTTTDAKPPDKKDDLKKDAETVINQDKNDEKDPFAAPSKDLNDPNVNPYAIKPSDNDVRSSDDGDLRNQYPKLSITPNVGTDVPPTNANKGGDDSDKKETIPKLSIGNNGGINAPLTNKKSDDSDKKGVEGNYIPDPRLMNNKGREVSKDNMRRPKPNPTDIEKDPSKGGMPMMSDESKLSYTQPVLIPQYTQPTNIHNLLSFDYALTTNAEYMRSRIQEANNKMFPRKDISDVKKMRKLRIDNNKNTTLKGGMPMSAFFYR